MQTFCIMLNFSLYLSREIPVNWQVSTLQTPDTYMVRRIWETKKEKLTEDSLSDLHEVK